MEISEKFLIDAEKKVFDVEQKSILKKSFSQYENYFSEAVLQYENLDLAKKRAANLKNKTIEDLDKYLVDFEKKFTQKGGKVIWAQDDKEAQKEILQILKKHEATSVVKAKSMLSEEIGLNKFLQENNIEALETDVGQYIQQVADEPSFHLVNPSIHKSKTQIAKLLNEKKGVHPESSAEDMVFFIRNSLREKYFSAQVGISGANFLIADSGSIALTENEGNIGLSVSCPKIHIVIAGIEKLIPSINDLDLFWSLLATYGTGQNITVYNSIVSGPRQTSETDGPEEMYVILLDNGRSNLLEKQDRRNALSCIRCGACQNVCPVFQNIGGHTYNTTYGGPIGSVITPLLKGMAEYKHLSFASPLCGKCTQSCPVNIDIHKMLLYNRRDSITEGNTTKAENWMWFFWKGAMLKRAKMEKGGAKVKNFMLKQFFKKSWGERRDLPQVAAKSFNQIWRERMKIS
ncbi:MAG TPA: lactate utilization protein B [Bacteroidia bacterium]|nr:lactate utilization protein B [Bacteroidia bacterium]